jgi:hypothetical protein
MNYAVEMGSGVMINIPRFIKTDSGIQKLLGGIHIQTHRQQGLISLYLSFKTRKVG